MSSPTGRIRSGDVKALLARRRERRNHRRTGQGTLLILKRTDRRRRYLMRNLGLLYSSAEIAAQWGFRDIVILRR